MVSKLQSDLYQCHVRKRMPRILTSNWCLPLAQVAPMLWIHLRQWTDLHPPPQSWRMTHNISKAGLHDVNGLDLLWHPQNDKLIKPGSNPAYSASIFAFTGTTPFLIRISNRFNSMSIRVMADWRCYVDQKISIVAPFRQAMPLWLKSSRERKSWEI